MVKYEVEIRAEKVHEKLGSVFGSYLAGDAERELIYNNNKKKKIRTGNIHWLHAIICYHWRR